MNRRTFLRTGTALAGGTALTGCLESLGFRTQSAWRDPPIVENRPDAVYYPAYMEGMEMYGMAKDGDFRFALMYSYPHRFWNVTGQSNNKVPVQSDDSLHLMISLWDAKTNTVVPADMQLTITKDGETVDDRAPWPMLSQTMGFHYGDNVTLDGNGSYTATVAVGSIGARRTGDFASRLDGGASTTIDFDFDTEQIYDVEYREIGEKQGSRDAIEPMMENVPAGRAPDPKKLPGTVVGTKSSGDADFVVTVVEPSNRFTDSDKSYLAVSPRTPYNRIVLPRLSLSMELLRNDNTISTGSIAPALDPELDNHYGTAVEDIQSGDTLRLTIDSPPQVARHDGYETAFMEMPPMEFTV
ncbi:twin-arginine translocation signal domain-containing protein [Haladaptatus cibarius]|uniref:twin-arginine translocation signal domain-containing protein n=1 Tax=Haladaptatus cibarius TaxID=453847 RepID=UPI000678D1ED|nr:twin-arginine translocation signal domain-containing protein [Haladaptatus cibarius]